jgi:hypothetical protein
VSDPEGSEQFTHSDAGRIRGEEQDAMVKTPESEFR